MQNPKNLTVVPRSLALAVNTYRVTSHFPAAERFGLTAQMRRAAVSIGSNISEGCGRQTDREFLHFLHIAMGSASELQFQLDLATELGIAPTEQTAPLADGVAEIKRMLSRLIVAVRNR